MNRVTVRQRFQAWVPIPEKGITIRPSRRPSADFTQFLAGSDKWITTNRELSQRELIEAEWIAMRLMVSAIQLNAIVVVDPQIRSGVPVLAGTRVSIAQIFVEIADGESIAEIADEYSLDPSDIKKLFEGMATQFDRSFLP